MAYYDANGTITIDEAAAKRDVSKINSAMTCLNQSRRTIVQLISCAESMQGQTGSAIVEKANEMLTRVDKLMRNLETSASLIDSTVCRYQQKDAELAAQIRG